MATFLKTTTLSLAFAVAAHAAFAWTEVGEPFVPTEGSGQSLEWTWADRDGSTKFDSYINALPIVQNGEVPYAGIVNTICARAENTCSVVGGFKQGVSADQQRYMLPIGFAPAATNSTVQTASAVQTAEEIAAQRQAQRDAFAAEVAKLATNAAKAEVDRSLVGAVRSETAAQIDQRLPTAIANGLQAQTAADDAAFADRQLVATASNIGGYDASFVLQWIRSNVVEAIMALAGLLTLVSLIGFIGRGLIQRKLTKVRKAVDELRDEILGEDGVITVQGEMINGQDHRLTQVENRVADVEEDQVILRTQITGVEFDAKAVKAAVTSLVEDDRPCWLTVTAAWDATVTRQICIERLGENLVRVHGVARNEGGTRVDLSDKGVTALIGKAGKDWAHGQDWRMPGVVPARAVIAA